jgi:putative transposase
MDGRGRCKDNIWIERFWRSIKREYIYLNPTDNVEILRKGIGHYIDDYNMDRPHQSLGGSTPYMFLFKTHFLVMAERKLCEIFSLCMICENNL